MLRRQRLISLILAITASRVGLHSHTSCKTVPQVSDICHGYRGGCEPQFCAGADSTYPLIAAPDAGSAAGWSMPRFPAEFGLDF
jgi:hypothetical protein